MTKLNSIFFLSAVMTVSAACTNDPVIPEKETKFGEQVLPIFENNCATPGCHDGSGQFSLQSYDEISSRVKAGDPRGSELYKVITKLSGNAMPPDGPLSDAQINAVYTWILQGAKDN